MKISLLLLSFVFAALSISAQVNPQCPTISVEEPAGLSRPGESSSFSVTVKPTESKLTYKWSVSSGVIISGQGTPSIQVRFDEAHEPSPTATVEIGGLPEECPKTASESTSIDRPPQPTKLDTFSLSLNSGDDGRLKSIARALSNEPTAQLYVLVPSNRSLWKPLVDRLSELIHGDLTGPRITIVEINGTNKIVEVWLIPPGATPPSKCEACDLSKSARQDCPAISVMGPAGITTPGGTMTFTVNDPIGFNGQFKWTVSQGAIESGRGTHSIEVRVPIKLESSDITATVELSGIDATCSNTASQTAFITQGEPLELDAYGRLDRNDEKARFAIALNYVRGSSPMKAVVAIRVPENSVAINFASRRRTIRLLLRELKAPQNRFVFVDAGNGELSTSIWIVPADSVPAMVRGLQLP